MKIKIGQEKLFNLLSRSQSVLERKSTRPILEHILLDAEDGFLKVCATDLRVSMEQKTPCDVEIKGAVSLNGRKIYEIVKEMPKEDISLEVKENSWVTISGSKTTFHLPGTLADEFPSIPDAPELLLKMNASIFVQMVSKTLFASSNDETRIYLCGVFFQEFKDSEGKDRIRLVATDGHRLSMVERDMEHTLSMFADGIIVPKKGVSELKSLLSDVSEDFEIACDEGKIFAKVGETLLSITLIDAAFPNYNQVLPEITGNGVIIPCDSFKNALRRVSILSDQETHSVVVEVEGNEMTMKSDNPSVGDARETIDVDYAGEGLKAAFNANYLMDILKVTEEDTIRLEVKDPLSPAIFIGREDDCEFLSVVMPMRID